MIALEKVTVREEHLQKLAGFCENLGRTLARAGLKPNEIAQVFAASLTGECVGCGIHVSGEELFALSQPPSAERANVKIGRLRLGDCARRGCDSYFYRLTFNPRPAVNWTQILIEIDTPLPEPARKRWLPEGPYQSLLRIGRSTFVRRLALALIVATLVLVARQFYLGGRVPFLREPEHFHVDTDPGEGNHWIP